MLLLPTNNVIIYFSTRCSSRIVFKFRKSKTTRPACFAAFFILFFRVCSLYLRGAFISKIVPNIEISGFLIFGVFLGRSTSISKPYSVNNSAVLSSCGSNSTPFLFNFPILFFGTFFNSIIFISPLKHRSGDISTPLKIKGGVAPLFERLFRLFGSRKEGDAVTRSRETAGGRKRKNQTYLARQRTEKP